MCARLPSEVTDLSLSSTRKLSSEVAVEIIRSISTRARLLRPDPTKLI